MKNALVFYALILLSELTHSYPQFIGFGYTNCMTCHYNAAGGGAINDYGRAVWAAEIAAKPFWNPSITDEELGEKSNSYFGRQGISWLKPGFKYRGLYQTLNPGSSQSSYRRIQMQADINAAIHFDDEDKYVAVLSGGYVPTPAGGGSTAEDKRHFVSHETYLRWQIKETVWVYMGFLDKTFGVRQADHTLFSRKQVGISQNDQTHSVMVHWNQPKSDFFLQPFVGNLFQSAELRQQGLTMMYESEPGERIRWGASLLGSTNKYVNHYAFGFHGKYGFAQGSSLIAEMGTIIDTPKTDTTKKEDGLFAMLEGQIQINRGLHFFSIGEQFKNKMDSSNPNLFRWHLGFLYFPFQRAEFRFEAVNSKQISPTEVGQPGWAMQSQMHLSL